MTDNELEENDEATARNTRAMLMERYIHAELEVTISTLKRLAARAHFT